MVLVPRGDSQAEGQKKTTPLPAFYIDQYEVTHGQYVQFLNAAETLPQDGGLASPSRKIIQQEEDQWRVEPGQEDFPVQVSFDGALAYCQWAGKELPTWPQWMRAACGDDGRRYPWGNTWEASCCVCRENSNLKPASVGSRPSGASPFGAHDMAGNVQEWVVLPPPLRRRNAVYGKMDRALAGSGYEGYSGGDVNLAFGQLDQALHMAYCSTCQYGTGFRCVVSAEKVVLSSE
jgi:formylglycine-generating enzyme required for sulfatase activity